MNKNMHTRRLKFFPNSKFSIAQQAAIKWLAIAMVGASSSLSIWIEAAQAQESTAKLTIHPRGESKQSLKIQLIPDASQRLEGNSAVYYLKALGFLEQDIARDRVRELIKKGAEEAKAAEKEAREFPPYSYLEMRPEQYPKEEVRAYLKLLDFQIPSLREARRLEGFNMHRHIQLSENPLGYLLPEMQAIRELARTQSIRCRLAIAENRIEDAIETLGQQVSMSRHISMDDFLVSYLVGVSMLNIAIDDTLLLLEHPQCPNLYWAFAQLPQPLASPERCLATEREFLYWQIPKLKDITTKPQSPDYWKSFIADFSQRTSDIESMFAEGEPEIVSKVQGERRVDAILKSIEGNAPQAKEYLVSRGVLAKDALEAYSKEHLVFLAMKDYYEVTRDDQYKWFSLPYLDAIDNLSRATDQIEVDREKLGWFTQLPNALAPSLSAFYESIQRSRQRIALVQLIEAIRMAAAENGGKLIESLDKSAVPVPANPFTGKPFSYQVSGDTAVITSELPARLPVRIELKMAK